jgi:penicillin-binding protein 2
MNKIHKKIALKNHQFEIQLVTQRALIAFAVLSIFIFLLVVRLAYLQIYKHNVYTTLSTKNWLDLVPIEPTRGLIYDRNGVLLAENIPVFSLDVIPMQVPDINKSLTALKKIIPLTDDDIHQFQKQRAQHRAFDEIPLKLRLSENEVAQFTENQHRFPGLTIKARLMRHYPYGRSFSHVLGYVGRINAKELEEIDQVNYSASHYIGKLGIEKYYEDELHGKVGYEEVENDASGKNIRILKKIKGMPGKNIYLTIDSGLQLAAEKALGDKRGAIVIIQPGTGQVLAMVSNPAYDPNLFVLGISQKAYHELQQASDRPLYNRALRGLYPPASTVKPYYGLQALESDIVTDDDTISDPGWFQLPYYSKPYHDSTRHGHGQVNLTKAITVSCDVYFYQLALELGINRMDDILTAFGFGTPTGIDLDEELHGLVASPKWKKKMHGARWYEGDTVLSSIGQGYMQATPLQLASAVATLANRGERFVPFLLLGENNPGSKSYQSQPSIALDPVILNDKSHWDLIIHAMQLVVSPQGTARRYGQSHSYTIAAKTGTAQIARRRNPNEEDKQQNLPENLRDHHLFIAFAPVDKPKIALSIITENSNTAIETAREIFDYYLGNKNVSRPIQIDVKKAGV